MPPRNPLKEAHAESIDVRLCLRPGCELKARMRGLCAACYRTALYLVKKGQATWALLEAHGKALPKQSGHRAKAYSWLMDWKKQGKRRGRKPKVALGDEREPLVTPDMGEDVPAS